MSLGRAVRERLRHHLLDRRLERIDAVARELEELRRERAEIALQIPTWDRVYVFDDTPDEDRLRKIDLALEPRVKVLRELREEVAKDLEKIGSEFPPFGIGVSIERAFRLAAGELRPGPTWAADKETLGELLSGIADRVAQSWVPDFDPGALLSELGDAERCRRAAAQAPGPLPTHTRLGIAPLSQQALAPLVAKRLLEGEFFTAQAEQRSAQEVYDVAARAAAEASTRVPLFERLNVFSEGPAQIALSERQEELTKAEEGLRRGFERSQALLHDALGGYPPLLVHQRALEARGMAELLRVERVATLSPEGRRREEEVVVPRALIVAALRRLIHAFGEAFPGVPLPLSVAQERSAIGARRRSPREHLERAVFTALEEGWARDLRQRALEHAALLGMTTRDLASQQAGGGWLGRLAAGAESLEERRAWHEVAATDCWRHVLSHTRRQCETLAPLAARDLVLRASRALTEVRTTPGEFSSPRECPLLGLPAVRSALSAVERSLGSHYDLGGSPFELLQAIATAAPSQSEEIPSAPFEPLARPQLVARLAGWFPSGLADRLAALGSVEPEEWLGAIDPLEAEPHDSERSQEVRALATELDLSLQAAYPPARLYFELARVLRRVDAIRTECAPRRVEISGKVETRYACELVRQGPAVEAMEALGRFLYETYGELPGAHELLLIWERSAVVESSWLAE